MRVFGSHNNVACHADKFCDKMERKTQFNIVVARKKRKKKHLMKFKVKRKSFKLFFSSFSDLHKHILWNLEPLSDFLSAKQISS